MYRFILLAVLSVSAFAQPVWTDVMNHAGQTNALSGTYWEFSSLDPSGYQKVPSTDIAAYSVMSVPRNGSGVAVSAGGNDPVCTVKPSYWTTNPPYYRPPQQRMESYQAGGIKGVGFLGNFQAGTIGTFVPGSYLIEATYFHEQACYTGGREYGWWYDSYNGVVYAYWEVNANCGASYCTAPSDANCTGCKSGIDVADNEPIGNWVNSQDYFSIYPTGNASACAFQVTVTSPAYATLYSRTFVVGTAITNVDPAFCANVTASAGETGYVTAGTVYNPAISALASSNELILSRVFVGK